MRLIFAGRICLLIYWLDFGYISFKLNYFLQMRRRGRKYEEVLCCSNIGNSKLYHNRVINLNLELLSPTKLMLP